MPFHYQASRRSLWSIAGEERNHPKAKGLRIVRASERDHPKAPKSLRALLALGYEEPFRVMRLPTAEQPEFYVVVLGQLMSQEIWTFTYDKPALNP